MTIIYNQPADDYHANTSIGSSTAKLWLISPQLVRDAMDGLYAVEDKGHYQIGKLAHQMILEPAEFKRRVVSEGPINKSTSKPYGRDTAAFATWQAANPDLTVVEPWLHTMLARMPAEIRAILSGYGKSEVGIYQTLAGVQVKARLDWLDDRMITDVKTINSMDDAERAISRFRYWFQAGWYRMLAKAQFGRAMGWQFVFCEKRPPFRWRVIELDADWLSYADEQADEVLGALSRAQKSGNWSDTGEVAVMASRPAWETADEDDSEESEVN